MFERFLSSFVCDEQKVFSIGASSASSWIEIAGGSSFDDGLYRVHSEASARASDELVGAAFPEFAGRLRCFGYDWLGRQFATDTGRGAADDPAVMLFEPGTGEALEIAVPFSRFHDEELVDYSEDVLARSFFDRWRSLGGEAPAISECVGYQRPLFLGGKDDVANLEISDLDVYWTIMGQLWQRVKGLPVGTPITDVLRDG